MEKKNITKLVSKGISTQTAMGIDSQLCAHLTWDSGKKMLCVSGLGKEG